MDSGKCVVCQVSSNKSCSNCKKVIYCGQQHQKLHRKAHKNECYPAKEVKNSEMGRHLIATRRIKAGEVICIDEPLVTAPSGCLDDLYARCLGCCQVLTGSFFQMSQICGKCHWPLCKSDCEKILQHSENECKIFQSKKVYPETLPWAGPLIYQSVLVLRILLLQERNVQKFQKIANLEGHIDRIKDNENLRDSLAFLIYFLTNVLGLKSEIYSVDRITLIYGIVRINSCEEYIPNIKPGAVCESTIYERSSKLCHSCCSNTATGIQDGSTISSIIALKDIEPEEILTQFYGGVYHEGKVETRNYLFRTYYFWCRCPRCSDKTEFGTYFSAIKCKQQGKSCPGYYLPLDSLAVESDPVWGCETCGSAKKYSAISTGLAEINADISKSSSTTDKIDLLKKHANVTVHENHFTLMKLRSDLLHPIFSEKNTIPYGSERHSYLSLQLESLAMKCLEVADKLIPKLSIYRGIFLFYLAQSRTKPDFNPEEHCPLREECKRIFICLPNGVDAYMCHQYLQSEKEFLDILALAKEMAVKAGVKNP